MFQTTNQNFVRTYRRRPQKYGGYRWAKCPLKEHRSMFGDINTHMDDGYMIQKVLPRSIHKLETLRSSHTDHSHKNQITNSSSEFQRKNGKFYRAILVYYHVALGVVLQQNLVFCTKCPQLPATTTTVVTSFPPSPSITCREVPSKALELVTSRAFQNWAHRLGNQHAASMRSYH